jgi:plasmid stability protein
MRTTLTVDDDIIVKLQERSKTTGKSFKEVVNEILRTGLLTQEALSPPNMEPFEVQARSLGLKPGLSYDNVAELLEQAEGAHYK